MKLSMEILFYLVFGMTYKYLKIVIKIVIIHLTLGAVIKHQLAFNIEQINLMNF